jgi:hypothetical protein
MDPYLEMPPYWADFSPGFLAEMRNALLVQLLPRYEVRIDEYLFVSHEEIRRHRVKPDLTVSATPAWQPGTEQATALAEPISVELDYPDIEPRTQRHLELVHRATGQVVTVVELLSPTNKAPGADGLDAYLEKRAEFLASRCHLIELDLLRGGRRLPMAGDLPPGDYYAFVGRVGRRPRCQIIGWPLRAALPTIPIPLLPGDPEATLNLQAAFRAAYDPSLYDRRLPYNRPLQPPLNPADQPWVAELLGQSR